MTAVPIQAGDVARIVDDACGRIDLKLDPAWRGAIVADLGQRLRFDHDARRFIVLDDAGHPHVDLDEAGNVREVTLAGFLRKAAKKSPHAFSPTTTAAGAAEANPFMPGLTFNRTKAAMLAKSDPETAARMKAEADAAAGKGNPWRAGPFHNRTEQAMIQRRYPELAHRLRNEAMTAGVAR